MPSGIKASCNRPKVPKHLRAVPKVFQDDPDAREKYEKKIAARAARKRKRKRKR